MIFAKKQTKHIYHVKILKSAPFNSVSLKIPEYMDMQIFFIANCWTQDVMCMIGLQTLETTVVIPLLST